MSPRARYPWWMPAAGWAGALLVRLLGASWRVTLVGVREYDRVLAGGSRCIFAFWHARMLALAYTHRGCGAAVLVSQHRDGELIARVVERLGFVTARGSSTRGGEEGLREMLSLAEQGHLLAITPDGPRGPAERVKPGLVYLASRTGWPVVPVGVAARPSRVLRSWDRFRVPLPFARVVVAYGAPIPVPPDVPEAGVEAWRARLEEAVSELTREVARQAGEET